MADKDKDRLFGYPEVGSNYGEEIGKSLGVTDYPELSGALQESLDRSETSAERFESVQKYKSILRGLKEAKKAELMGGVQARRLGTEEDFQAGIKTGMAKVQAPEKHFMQKVGEAISWPDEQARAGVAKLAGADPERWRTDEQLLKTIKTDYPSVKKAADYTGVLPFGAIAAGSGLGAAIWESVASARKEGEGSVIDAFKSFPSQAVEAGHNWLEFAKTDAKDFGGDFQLMMALAPTSYIGFGTVGAEKKALQQTAKIGKTAKLNGTNMKKLMDGARQIFSAAEFDQVGHTTEFIKLFKSVGIEPDNPAIKKIMGRDLVDFGKSGLDIGVPLLPKIELVRLAPFLPENLMRKALRGAAKGVRSLPHGDDVMKIFTHPWFTNKVDLPPEVPKHTIDAIHSAAKKVYHESVRDASTKFQILSKDIIAIGKEANISPEKLAKIARHVFDPQFEVVQSSLKDLRKGDLIQTKNGYGIVGGTKWIKGRLEAKQVREHKGRVIMYVDENGDLAAKTAKDGDYVSIVNKAEKIGELNDGEKKYIELVDEYLENWREILKTVHVLNKNQVTFNPASGYYLPRRWKKPDGFLTETFFPQSDSRMLSTAITRKRTGPKIVGGARGAPLGGEGDDAIDNMDVLLSSYTSMASRAVAAKNYSKWIADHFAVGKDMDAAMKTLAGKGNRFVRVKNSAGKMVNVPESIYTPLTQAASGQFQKVYKGTLQHFVKLAGGLQNMFKKAALVSVPRYHANNIFSDTMLMYANGFENPLRMVQARRVWNGEGKIIVTPSGREIGASEIREYLGKHGVGSQVGKMDIDPTDQIRPAMLKVARAKAAGKIAPSLRNDPVARGEAYWNVASLGFQKPGQALVRAWDQYSKTAFFIDRLVKGDTMDVALRRTHEVLFDYADQPGALQVLRKLMPFATWQYKAVKAIPRSVVRKPALATIPRKTGTALSQESRDEAPDWQSRQGTVGRPSKNLEARIKKGASIPEGKDISARIRNPVEEGLPSNLEQVAGMLTPVLKAVYEFASQKDSWSGRGLRRPELSKPFAKGDPIAEGAAELLGLPKESFVSSDDQMPWLSKNIPQYFIPPITLWFANEWARQNGAPGPIYGPNKPYGTRADQQQWLRFLSLFNTSPQTSFAVTDPFTGITNRERKVEGGARSFSKAKRRQKDLDLQNILKEGK